MLKVRPVLRDQTASKAQSVRLAHKEHKVRLAHKDRQAQLARPVP